MAVELETLAKLEGKKVTLVGPFKLKDLSSSTKSNKLIEQEGIIIEAPERDKRSKYALLHDCDEVDEGCIPNVTYLNIYPESVRSIYNEGNSIKIKMDLPFGTGGFFCMRDDYDDDIAYLRSDE